MIFFKKSVADLEKQAILAGKKYFVAVAMERARRGDPPTKQEWTDITVKVYKTAIEQADAEIKGKI